MKWTTAAALYLFWPAILLVSWGELTPNPPHWSQHFWDKSLHFTAYFGLASMATLAIGVRRQTVWALLAIALFGAALEVLQGFTGRDPDVFDVFANGMGVATGFLCAWMFSSLMNGLPLVAMKSED